MMIRIWQDFDVHSRNTWGMWFGTISHDGNIIDIVGPYNSAIECYDKLKLLYNNEKA